MTNRKETAFVLVALAALFGVAAIVALPGYSQSVASPAGESRAGQASPEALASSIAVTNSEGAGATGAAASLAFAPAAKRNALLCNDLNWAFGGKQQRGWTLYLPLIARTLDTEDDAGTGDFAHALSRWQASAGLQPSGVLDGETWYAMIAGWQARRIKERAYPRPEQLHTAAASEFYDPERVAELRQVERETYAAYKRMVAAAVADPTLKLVVDARGELAAAEKFLKIISAFRSKEYQERLRKLEPGAGRAALAVNSPHFTGRALDLYVGGDDPVSTKDYNRAMQTRTPVYQWLVKNASRFGFYPYYYEPWHWEYIPPQDQASRE